MYFNELDSLLKVHRYCTVFFWGQKKRVVLKVHRLILGTMAPNRHFMRKQNLKSPYLENRFQQVAKM